MERKILVKRVEKIKDAKVKTKWDDLRLMNFTLATRHVDSENYSKAVKLFHESNFHEEGAVTLLAKSAFTHARKLIELKHGKDKQVVANKIRELANKFQDVTQRDEIKEYANTIHHGIYDLIHIKK